MNLYIIISLIENPNFYIWFGEEAHFFPRKNWCIPSGYENEDLSAAERRTNIYLLDQNAYASPKFPNLIWKWTKFKKIKFPLPTLWLKGSTLVGISKGMLLTIQNNTKQNMLAKFRNMMILTRYIIIKFFKEDSSGGIIECVWYSVNRATPNWWQLCLDNQFT